ncbi:DUF2553 family protein [Salipaludibacillus aurantiacus]|uniref:DUF2553 family protein n=1 Tax=Salipaludibacillus aurantiacus TaxID=1601833 RepID=A0A1H9WVI1_9BACI|nr:DUF2553 family protein [Salipaludibacillus aurantiacus]SES37697.1 Protein of unknown function [Salipaludibacillus aurantiacus]
MANDDFFHVMGDDVKKPSDKSNSDTSSRKPESRIEISGQIEKKQESPGETGLYYQAEKVGRIKQKGSAQMYEMAEGFEFKDEKFYKHTDKKESSQYPESYVEGCDMGWC